VIEVDVRFSGSKVEVVVVMMRGFFFTTAFWSDLEYARITPRH